MADAEGAGSPDGLAVDLEGGYLVAPGGVFVDVIESVGDVRACGSPVDNGPGLWVRRA